MDEAKDLVEHLIGCTNADAALVVDGNADDIVAELTASGWALSERVDLVAGKRIRFMVPPL